MQVASVAWLARVATTLVVVVALAGCAGSGGEASRRSGTSSTTAVTVMPTAPGAGGSTVPAGRDAVVTQHVDGDTIGVDAGERVRLIGINTPETRDPRRGVECFGKQAAAHTASLLPVGTGVRLVPDVERLDRYGRTLAYVYRSDDGLFVNLALVADGYAQVATYPPNVARTEELLVAQRDARAAGRGLWSACGGDDPAPSTAAPGTACDPAYPDVCIPSPPPDLDCADVAARGFRVLAPDPHRFDGGGDGIGCET